MIIFVLAMRQPAGLSIQEEDEFHAVSKDFKMNPLKIAMVAAAIMTVLLLLVIVINIVLAAGVNL
jgi:hypothetical protein